MWHFLRALLLILPRLVWSYFAWIIKYSNHPEKYPLDIRYKRTRKLIKKANRLLKFDIKVEGLENIPQETCCIFSNHLAAVDPLLLIEVFDKPTTFVGKVEIKKIPVVGRVFTGINGLFLDRDDLKQQLKVMMKVQDSLRNKECNWIIYPEGTRNKDPMKLLLPFHHGTFRAAMKAKVPLLPVVNYGTFRTLNFHHSYKRYPTYLKFLKPIYPEEYEGKTTEEIALIIQKQIQKELSFNVKATDHKRMLELNDKYYRFNNIK